MIFLIILFNVNLFIDLENQSTYLYNTRYIHLSYIQSVARSSEKNNLCSN